MAIDVDAPPLPAPERRLDFMHRYAEDSGRRLDALRTKDDAWWEETVSFFGEPRSRAWVMVRRIAHTAHHRGQQTALLRMAGRDLHSVYGPTADTGGLMQNEARVVYACADLDQLFDGEASREGARPGCPDPVTSRPPNVPWPENVLADHYISYVPTTGIRDVAARDNSATAY